jgi:tRNA modification GTPase
VIPTSDTSDTSGLFDTIAAVATGAVTSAVGIVRLSGPAAIEIASRVFAPVSGKSLSGCRDRCLVLGELRDADGALIDRCLCAVSRAPNSYTGENTAELQCHGSPTVLRLTLEALFHCGARQAFPGEFTKRAFLNGRMDLTRAEAVIDLIDAETGEAARNAAGQLGGAILRRTDTVYAGLVDIISHYHAVLDYPDEDIDEFHIEAYEKALERAGETLEKLLATFARGRVMKDGVRAVIVGKPNVGKSSLLNALVGFDRAIVTAVPGTTRDTVEECISLRGIKLRLSDTAGLRGTRDPVESLGVERALQAAASADLALAVFDGSEPFSDEDEAVIRAAGTAGHAVAVINKTDLPRRLDSSAIERGFETVLHVSARGKTGLDALDSAISALYPLPGVPIGEILTNARHADAAGRALASIKEAAAALRTGATPDIILTEIETALAALGELSGKTVRDDVVKRIFERFCVGK